MQQGTDRVAADPQEMPTTSSCRNRFEYTGFWARLTACCGTIRGFTRKPSWFTWSKRIGKKFRGCSFRNYLEWSSPTFSSRLSLPACLRGNFAARAARSAMPRNIETCQDRAEFNTTV
ncbi:hypothetical protein VTI74DRAFT_247 [Chaetomium olivicolor]